jgi:hypothetical protein
MQLYVCTAPELHGMTISFIVQCASRNCIALRCSILVRGTWPGATVSVRAAWWAWEISSMGLTAGIWSIAVGVWLDTASCVQPDAALLSSML